jgi:CRISPR-associated protein Csx10
MSLEVLTLKVVSPLALHRRRASEQFAPTLDYISGSTIRGAFADLYLAGNPGRAQEQSFKELFLSGETCFSDFFPSSGDSGSLARVLPKTAVACKRFDDHYLGSLSDSLLYLELLREREVPDLVEKFNQWRKCPDCQTEGLDCKRDPVEAGYYLTTERPERIKVKKRMIASAAIDRATGTAAHGMLFSHDVVEEINAQGSETHFTGLVSLPEGLRLELHDLAPIGTRLAVGYARSRGLGQLEVRVWDTPRAAVDSLGDRWAALNMAAQRLWQYWNGQQNPLGQYFSLTLQSHLAVRDDRSGQPVLGEIEASHLGLPPQAERCRSVLTAIAVPGWNVAQGMPKADTWALERSSVLLFRLSPDVDATPTLERLTEIERDGIGERRSEGFGRMTACDPFHYHFTLYDLKGVS